MYLIYFDENKFSVEDPYFYIGGILVEKDKVQAVILQMEKEFPKLTLK